MFLGNSTPTVHMWKVFMAEPVYAFGAWNGRVTVFVYRAHGKLLQVSTTLEPAVLINIHVVCCH